MIPSKLSLRNFMCYRDKVPPLSFDNIHTACLCGNNGNGKSALLDAITWALWGKTRAKSDAELIHLGQGEMEVEFEFVLNADRYRILRKRTKGKPRRPGQTVLELQIATSDGFQGVSGDSVTETERKIQQILNMDYSTFINSAYLRQGHADEFTVKQPGQRKKVLADILGLSLYDELEERAKDQARKRGQTQRELQSAIAEMEREIVRKEEHATQLLTVKETLAELSKKVTAQEEEANSLRDAKRALDFKQEQLSELKARIEREAGELVYWQNQVSEHVRKVREYEATLGERPGVEKGYDQLQQTRRQIEDLNAKLRQLLGLTDHKNTLERTIVNARGELLTEQRLRQSKTGELEAQLQKTPKLKEEWSQAQRKLEQIAQQEDKLGGMKQQVQEILLRIEHLRTTNVRLSEELKELEGKLALLKQGDTTCPLCETQLGIPEKQRIEQKYVAEIDAKSDALQKNREEISHAAKEYQTREKQIRQSELHIRKERTAEQGKVLTLDREIAQADKAGLELVEQRKRLAEVEERLDKEDFVPDEQKMFKELEQQMAAMGYSAERHHQAQQCMAELERYDDLHRMLEEAAKLLPTEETASARAKEAFARSSAALEDSKQRMATLSSGLAALPELTKRLKEVEQAYGLLFQRQTGAQEELGRVRERLARCASLEKDREGKRQALLEAAREEELYEELASAFGKRGIQAFIIESAIPEIEAEANRLLGRMTDNRMHVKIETQKETTKGEVVETLEIKISDELGTRNYEMYSGGEAFRINFALRIALSRLLARRAGAPLATLFIDEGFGTQDSSGLDKLVGAINSVQDDFEKIIVITHLDELKDAFPVRIDVIKTAEGSTLSVN